MKNAFQQGALDRNSDLDVHCALDSLQRMEHLFSLKMRLAPSLPSNHGWIMDNEIQVVGNFSGYEMFPILVISTEAYVAKGLAPMCVRNGDRRGEQTVAEFSFLNP